MSNYPTGKDNLKVDTAGNDEMTAHAELHNTANDAINAIQDFIGTSAGDGSVTIVEGINFIAGHVEAIENALGVTIEIDADGNVTITPNQDGPVIPIPSDDTKLDKGTTRYDSAEAIEKDMDGKFPAGDGDLKYTDAKALGDAVDELAQGGGSSDDDKFDVGEGPLDYKDATVLGKAVKANEEAITNINENGYDDEELRGLIGDKFDKGTGDLEYPDAVALEQAVKKNEGNISTNADNITINSENFNDLLAELNLTIDNGNIVPGEPDPDNPLDISSKFDKGTGTTTLNDATLMEEAIDKNAEEITKNKTNIENISTNIGGTINIDGTVQFPDDVETDLSKLATKQEREDGDTANANAIGENTNTINALSNRLDALENTTLSAEWTIRTDGGEPEEGQVSLNDADWANVTVLKISTTDASGGTYNFENVKPGDTVQIGVGPDSRAAGSSAAYTVDSAAGGEFGVTHLASTGSPTDNFTAVIAVYPAFDPSNYATKGELDAVSADKLSKGEGLVAATAKVLEDAINTNAGDITTNATNISNNATAILDNSKAIDANKENIENVVTIIGGEVTDGNITLPDPIDIDSKLDKGTDLVAQDAKELEEAIDTNATNIDANKENINNLVVNIGGTVNPDTGVIELPNGGDPIDISGKFDKGAAQAADAKELEDKITANATDIGKLVEGLGGDIENIEVDALPDQTDAEGKFLSSVAGEAVWEDIPDVNLDGYATEDYVDEEVKSKVSFVVNANDENLFCNSIVTLTQAEYDALSDRDPNTLYLAVDA